MENKKLKQKIKEQENFIKKLENYCYDLIRFNV